MDKSAKWIWTEEKPFPGQIASFKKEFEYTSGKTVLSLVCETDYIAYVNGERASFLQFPNYPGVKYIEETDITGLCRAGGNALEIIVRYEGRNTATHIDNGPCLIYAVECEGNVLARSDADTLSGNSGKYVQGVEREITFQLGNAVDMCAEKETVYGTSIELDLSPELRKRPVEKLLELPKLSGREVAGMPRVYDLGREEAGYLFVRVRCGSPATVTISYGEHINDGCVRRKIGHRDFSLNFECAAGENCFENLFVRLGARYLQVEGDCIVEDIGIIPVLYPVTENENGFEDLDRRIYETSVRTMRLCMHEHYEDCPWREQGLYILDSRNQMKCGYYAFKEHEFQKQNLLYMLNGQREDGMMDLTFPTWDSKNAIPSFSLMYPVSICEYVEATGDLSILDETMPAMNRIYAFFEKHIDGTGLIANPSYWNFYEWTDGNSDGKPGNHDLIINCYYIYSLMHFEKLCSLYGTRSSFSCDGVKKAVVSAFFDETKGMFRNCLEEEPGYSQMGNALAILCGLGDERTAEELKNNDAMVKASLSTVCFVYDALLYADPANGTFVLDDIRKNYGYMLDHDATSFWETMVGEPDFGNAGSLCHGWSAMPVYYFSKLLKRK